MTAPLLQHRVDPWPGIAAALLVLCVYGGVAVAVDFPRAAFGIQSDEATYYVMGHSLAEDRDLTYRREDLQRVWREFPDGPSGIFLKRGTDLDLRVTARWPFVEIEERPDPDTGRLFFGKSYIYPLVAAPLVAVFGTNGFLVLHAFVLAAMVLAGYLFLNARSAPLVAVTLSAGFLMASVAPVYFVWITPELFNLGLIFLGYFCWIYKEVASPPSAGRRARWLFTSRSDLAAAVLLGMATFSKPSNLILIGPLLAWLLWRRQWRTLVAVGSLYAAVGALLLVGNIAVSGEWNFQGGDRRTFYGQYPFQSDGHGWEDLGQAKITDRVLTEIIFDRRVFFTVLSHNLAYAIVGRYSGLLPYFFPALFAVGAFLVSRRDRRPWQWLVLAAAVAQMLLLLIWVPYTYNGGGGSVGNRYFMNTYGVFLFLLPPIGSFAAAIVPWAVGSLFSAPLVLNPFYTSYHPADHPKHGPLRLLPVELTLVNDLPINTRPERVRVWFGVQRRFQIYFLDDNAYSREEGLFFWTKGTSRAEVLVKTVEPVSGLDLQLVAGAVPAGVTIRWGWWTRQVRLRPGQAQTVTVPLDQGFPYVGTRVWRLSIAVDSGFVPALVDPASQDRRYLGVRVTPELKN